MDASEGIADVTFVGASLGDRTGHDFGSGDFNGDGVLDLLILSADELSESGAAFMHIFFGGQPRDSIIDLAFVQQSTLVVTASAGDVGIYSSVTTGDFNKDGFDDICLGIPNQYPFLNSDGKAYVIFGTGSFTDTLDLSASNPGITTIRGVSGIQGWLGLTTSTGDINGDAIDDLIISAPNVRPGGDVYVILGRDAFPEIIDLDTFQVGIKRITESEWYQGSGFGLASGDVNSDGFADLLIGGSGNNAQGSNRGKVTLVFGGDWPDDFDLSGTSVPMKRIYGEYTDGQLGWKVAVGDFDGDDFKDLILASPFAEPFGCEACGEVYVVYGNQDLPDSFVVDTTELTVARLLGGGTRQYHGLDMACGDVSGDGYDDIIVTSSPDGRNTSDVGHVTVVYGSEGVPDPVFMTADTLVTRFDGEDRQDSFGEGLGSSDVNGDGVADLLIGARHAAPFGRGGAGKAYLFYGIRAPRAVQIDIRPGSFPNPLNMSKEPADAISRKGGVLPVAMLGSETLDVTDIDLASLRLENVTPLSYDVRDVAAAPVAGPDCPHPNANRDGRDDLILYFRRAEVADSIGPAHNGDIMELTLTGLLNDGTPLLGTDCVTIVGVPSEISSAATIGDVMLGRPMPNPFNPTTRISYSLPTASSVILSIYDVAGRLVERLVDHTQPAGEHVVEWNASDMSSGIYFCRIQVGNITETRRLVLIK
jgi:hypothetical protein